MVKVIKRPRPALPRVIVHPPEEEDLNEPCISYPPSDNLQGLPNPHGSKPRSAINAILQVFSSLPDLNEELPFSSQYAAVADFVRTCMCLHGDPHTDDASSPRIAAPEAICLDWWRSAARLPPDTHPAAQRKLPLETLDALISSLFEDVLLLTRFGQRFATGLVHVPHPDHHRHQHRGGGAEHTSLSSGSESESTDDALSSTRSNHETVTFIQISMAQYPRDQCVTLLSLLNDLFGHRVATFFFGGPFTNRSLVHSPPGSPPPPVRFTGTTNGHVPAATADDHAASSPPPPRSPPQRPRRTTRTRPPRKRQTRFTHLPNFFTVVFERPLYGSPSANEDDAAVAEGMGTSPSTPWNLPPRPASAPQSSAAASPSVSLGDDKAYHLDYQHPHSVTSSPHLGSPVSAFSPPMSAGTTLGTPMTITPTGSSIDFWAPFSSTATASSSPRSPAGTGTHVHTTYPAADAPPSPASPFYHNTPIELPSEVDLGFYLADRQASDQKTFYRLHGFVTQTEGHFLAYTRLRGGPQWYKCDDERVSRVELGPRVESRGVVLVVYRLQVGPAPA